MSQGKMIQVPFSMIFLIKILENIKNTIDVHFSTCHTIEMYEISCVPVECDRNQVIFSNLITLSNFRCQAGVWNFPSFKRRDDANYILLQKHGTEN